MNGYTDEKLDEMLAAIDGGAYKTGEIVPVRIHSEKGRDIISIPNSGGTHRRVFERKEGELWQEVPFKREIHDIE